MELYNDYNSYLRRRYGTKVYKIALDAGFGCPGRCAYCNEDGSRASYIDPAKPIGEQLGSRIEYLKSSKGAEKFIAYFQAFTNTYAQADKLKKVYDEVLPFKEVVGINIGTRPDTIDMERLKLIASYKDRYEIWIEYGLQSIHDRTLRLINRGHDFSCFVSAFNMTKKLGVSVCAHTILGLPGETREDMSQTAKELTRLKIDGVKIHLLHILKGSRMEKSYREGLVDVMGQDEYVNMVCDFLENLSPDIVIHRLTGEGDRIKHIAPDWALDKIGTINKIKDTLQSRRSYQGFRCGHRQQ